GEHLLAAGVDAHRAAAEERDLAVGVDRGEVAGAAVALAVDLEERRRRLLRVLVVADGLAPADGEATDLVRAGLDRAVVLVDDDGLGAQLELGGLGGGAGAGD